MFRADVNRLVENAVKYNGEGHEIAAAALELRDTALRFLSDYLQTRAGAT